MVNPASPVAVQPERARRAASRAPAARPTRTAPAWASPTGIMNTTA